MVEIGAGLGALTEPLLARAAKVVAIERDRDLCPILRDAFADAITAGKLDIVEDDAKRADLGALLTSGPSPRCSGRQSSVPAHRTAARASTTSLGEVIDRAVFMVQAEVADRLVAAPRRPSTARSRCSPGGVRRVARHEGSRGAFHPRPGVDSGGDRAHTTPPAARRRRPKRFALRYAQRSRSGARRCATRGASSARLRRSSARASNTYSSSR